MQQFSTPQEQERLKLLNYLNQEEPINPIKLRFCEENEATEKENLEQSFQISSSKRVLDDESRISFLSSRDQNISQYNEDQSCQSKATETRESQLQRWKESKSAQKQDSILQKKQSIIMKDNRNDSGSSVKKTPIKLSSSKSAQKYYEKAPHNSVEPQEYQTQAQLVQKYFNNRVGYGDGKSPSQQKTPTKPQSPKFHTAQRSQIYALKSQVFEVTPKSSAKKIDPKNFFLQTDLRAKQREETTPTPSVDHNSSIQFKARPVPEYKTFSVKKGEKHIIEFNEFNLTTEERGRTKHQELIGKLEQEKKTEEELREFHASKIPDYNEMSQLNLNLKGIASPKPTLPQEFKFHTGTRAEIHNMSKSPNHSNEGSGFKFIANKMPNFSKIKEVPKPSPKKITVPVGIHLSSTVRAEERKLFDQVMEEKIRQQSLEEKRQQEEESEEADLPSFKAQPIKKYKAVIIHKSDIPLTQPESPKFLTDQRLKNE